MEIRGTALATAASAFLVSTNASKTISGIAKATSGGTLSTGDLHVREMGGSFFDSKAMKGIGSQRSASITVPRAGSYEVVIDVVAGDGTVWEATASLGGQQKDTSGPRTVTGGSDQWFTDITVA